MKKTLFPLLIALSALAVSGSAAFYSVFGLSKLFAGASTQVIIMAGSLEFAKLVVASLLYQYWDTINKVLRIYLSIACFVLILITSGGIYGFLSGAYQETATKSEFLDKSLVVLQTKQNRFSEQKEDLTIEKTQLNTTISDLRTSLSSPTSVSYWDENSQSVITTTSSSARRALQSELKTTIEDRDNINLKLEAVMDSVMRIDTELLELEIGNEEQRELGPLKYLAETTGKPMGQVVNWFLLLIIFVFDPLAIALVVAANFAFSQIRPKEEENFIIQTKGIDAKDVKMSKPDGLEFNTPYTMEEVSEAFARQDQKEDKNSLDIDEQRMNVIGQNGNDGLHYDETDIPLDRLTDTTQTLIVGEENIRVIKSDTDLEEEELIELSKEIGKVEQNKEHTPVNPTEKDLENLANALNIKYENEKEEKTKLRYKGR